MSARAHARAIALAAIAAADPAAAVRRALRLDAGVLEIAGEMRIDLDEVDRIWVLGAGKATGAMASAVLELLGGRVSGGAVTLPGGRTRRLDPLEVWEGSHPHPGTGGLAGAARALAYARLAGARELVLCLLSGGASALWPAPPAGVALGEVADLAGRLLRAVAPIAELNTVRRHLSRIAGGWLAQAAHPARVVTLAISDVVGDALEVIGSGPTLPDASTFADALAVLERFELEDDASPAVAWLRAGAEGRVPETPRPGARGFDRDGAWVIASGRDALAGAAAEAARLGYQAEIVADDMEGEARSVATQVAELALERQRGLAPGSPPLALLLAGETTVTVRGAGRGGRNQELALALALELEGREGIVAAAVGTDGVDGPTPAAGAIVDGTTVRRGAAAFLDAHTALTDNDSHTFLAGSDDLLVTGPTGTNVADVLVMLVEPREVRS